MNINILTFCLCFFLISIPLVVFGQNKNDEAIFRLDSLIKSADAKIDENWLGALEDYLLAEQIALKLDKLSYMNDIYEPLSFIYQYRLNNVTESLVYRNKGYENAIRQKDTLGMIRFLGHIGEVYIRFESYDKAKDYFETAYKLNEHYKNLEEQKLIESNFILLYSSIGDYEKLLHHFDRANLVFNKNMSSKNSELDLANHINLGGAILEMGNPKESLEYVEETRKMIQKDSTLVDYLPYVWAQLSKSYHELGQWNKSIVYADSAIQKAERYYSDLALDIDFYNCYSNSLNKLGKRDEAIETLKAFLFKTDSIMQDKLINEAINFEAANQVRQKVDRLELDNKITLENLEKTENFKKFLLYALGLLLLLFPVFYFKYKKNQLQKELLEIKQKQSKTTIDRKNRELAAKLLHLSNKETTLGQVVVDLARIEEGLEPAQKLEIRELLNKIKSNIKLSKDRSFQNDFEKRFEEIHPDFYDRLLQTHNNLTRGEKLLCAYLKLHLNTKEIAKISGNTVGAIEVNRSRLRKKLGISNTSLSLNSYLQKI